MAGRHSSPTPQGQNVSVTDTILVTGGTGSLGRPLVDTLRAQGSTVRVLSRKAGDGRAVGDLRSGTGLDEALAGIRTVIHCATDGRTDVTAAKQLLAAAERAGVQHLVYISIVGVDRHPLPYYRLKLQVEELVEASSIDSTILRATQFHDLVHGVFRAQRWLPVLFTPACSFQPISTHDVATRLAELALAAPAGRAADIGGPEVVTSADLARQYLAGTGRRRRIVPLKLPGRSFAAYANGTHLAPDHRYGTGTFAEFLAGLNP
jgi:uncharacterized protein YbjT (DUF2867 family)